MRTGALQLLAYTYAVIWITLASSDLAAKAKEDDDKGVLPASTDMTTKSICWLVALICLAFSIFKWFWQAQRTRYLA